MHDVIIIGAGPAGLFAADRLARNNIKALVIDERTYCGGSGAYTDGKLIFHPEVTMDLEELKITEKRAREIKESTVKDEDLMRIFSQHPSMRG